jgi:hypothetical protein
VHHGEVAYVETGDIKTTLNELTDSTDGFMDGVQPLRDQFKADPEYERTVEFCAKYVVVSFDPHYPNEPLSTFEPMVRKLLAKAWVPPQ